ncbi:MAG: electron transport complex subunit RsxG [Gammaproteobacteria bacterium]|nr:electron transport complex subunit RsxG [Gammaproteobacteria bacterium]
MNRQVFITAIILSLFAIIGGGLVAFTEKNTAAQIQANDKMALQLSLNSLLPAERYDNDLTTATLSLSAQNLLGTETESTVYVAKQNKQVSAFVFNAIAPNGYNGKIFLLIGIYTDEKIAAVRVVKHQETPGLGDGIEARRSDWILAFDNQSLTTLSEKQWKVKRDGGHFDQFTGATITPRAIVKAVHNCLLYYQQHKAELLQAAEKNTTNATDVKSSVVKSTLAEE